MYSRIGASSMAKNAAITGLSCGRWRSVCEPPRNDCSSGCCAARCSGASSRANAALNSPMSANGATGRSANVFTSARIIVEAAVFRVAEQAQRRGALRDQQLIVRKLREQAVQDGSAPQRRRRCAAARARDCAVPPPTAARAAAHRAGMAAPRRGRSMPSSSTPMEVRKIAESGASSRPRSNNFSACVGGAGVAQQIGGHQPQVQLARLPLDRIDDRAASHPVPRRAARAHARVVSAAPHPSASVAAPAAASSPLRRRVPPLAVALRDALTTAANPRPRGPAIRARRVRRDRSPAARAAARASASGRANRGHEAAHFR